MILLSILLIPLFAGICSYLLPLKLGKYLSAFTHIVLVGLVGITFFKVHQQKSITLNVGSWPDYIGISLTIDTLGAIMLFLTVFLFCIIAAFYLTASYCDKRMIFLMLVLEGLICTIFAARDLFTIFVVVEVSVLVVSILIMYKKDSQAIYDGILYLLLNTVAMVFFMFGLAILYKMTGTLDLLGIKEKLTLLEQEKAIILPYAFMITGVSLKAAVMPLFSWLPRAHGTPSAPSAVSAILSALYIKSGIYTFLRVQDMFSPVVDTRKLFLVFGLITALVGALFALSQTDIKLLLAYSTVSQMGLVMMGMNMNSEKAFYGAIYHLVAHGLFKATLFLSAGILMEEYQVRKLKQIQGVAKRKPVVAFAWAVGLLGLVGAPFFNGSISKYWISYGGKNTWLEYALLIVNFTTLLYGIKLSLILFGDSGEEKKKVHQAQTIGIIILSCGIIASGIFGNQLMEFLFGKKLSFSIADYALKQLFFFGTFLLASMYYLFHKKTRKVRQMIYGLELDFNGLCFMITGFFLFMVLYQHILLYR